MNDKDDELKILSYVVDEYKKVIDIHNNVNLKNQKLNNSYRKERIDTFKYLGTITAGAVALIPQVINRIENFNTPYVYAGIASLCLSVVISAAYIIFEVDERVNELVNDQKDEDRIFYEISQPQLNFIVSGRYELDQLKIAMSGSDKYLKEIKAKSDLEDDKIKKREMAWYSWYIPMNYVGEYNVLFATTGFILLILGILNKNLELSNIIWGIVLLFVFINLISSFSNKIFTFLGFPMDLIKSIIRLIYENVACNFNSKDNKKD